VVQNAIRHSVSVKCLISGDGAVGGAVLSAVEEMRNRLQASYSSTSAAHRVIGT